MSSAGSIAGGPRRGRIALRRATHRAAARTLEIYSDREICNNCKVVLPKVALELGNPVVTFIDKWGRRFPMLDGKLLP